MLLPEARFCRQCGRPTPRLSQQGSVTEETTRLLDAQGPGLPPNFNAQPGEAAYLAPQPVRPLAGAPATTGLEKPGGRGGRVFISLLVVAVLAIISVALAARWWSAPRVVVIQQPSVEAPDPPDVEAPEVPEPPNAPPPAADGSAATGSALVYPGAKVLVNVNHTDGPSVLQLRTKDGLDKVVRWYVARLKPERFINMPGAPVFLHADDVKVHIRPEGDATMIDMIRD